MLATSVALLLVTLVDLVILWIPVRFGTAAWESATITRTLTSMPLILVSLVLAGLGLMTRPGVSEAWLRGLSVVMAGAALFVVAVGALYALAVPAVFAQVEAGSSDAAMRAVVKTATELVAYPIALAVMAAAAWRYGRSG